MTLQRRLPCGGGRRSARPLLFASIIVGGSSIAGCSSDDMRTVAAPQRGSQEDVARPDTSAPGDTTKQDSAAGGPGGRNDGVKPPPGPDLYDPDFIPQFELTLDAEALAILSGPKSADGEETWVHGAFKFGDVTFADVGVRRKGSSSFRALPQKAAFKIKFNKWVKKQKLAGLEELTLNNNASDYTHLEQRLAYHVFRSIGLPAMKANTAQLKINGENYGVYTNIETPDENFLARVFGAKARTLYEVRRGASWLPGSDARWETDVAAPDEPEGTRSDLNALFRAVQSANDATLLRDLAGHLHTDRYLRFCAAEAVTGHHDGYAYGHYQSGNHFMAGDTDGKFTLIPWSTDETFSQHSGADIDVATPVPEDLILARCRRTPACWDSYKAEVRSVLAEFEALDLVALAKRWNAQIDEIVRADPKLERGVADYESRTDRLYDWIAGRATVVRTQLGL